MYLDPNLTKTQVVLAFVAVITWIVIMVFSTIASAPSIPFWITTGLFFGSTIWFFIIDYIKGRNYDKEKESKA